MLREGVTRHVLNIEVLSVGCPFIGHTAIHNILDLWNMGNEATSLQNIPTTNLVRERYTPPLFPVMSPSDQRKGKHSPKISCFDDPEMNSIADNGKRTIKEINEQI